MAIGIGIHDSLDLTSANYLVTQGVLDGLAAGILIYDGLVNIVIPHFNGKNFRHSPIWRKFAHVFSLCAGSALMAVISIWA